MLLMLLSSPLAADLSVVVVGDTQTDGDELSVNWEVFPQIVEDMNTHSPDVGLFVGDLVGGAGTVSGTVEQWRDFKSVVAGFTGFPLLVPGNHDVYGGTGTFAAFRRTFDWLPTDDSPPGEGGVSYYYDLENVRFISITSDQEVSNPYNVSSGGLSWLDRVLSESDRFDHVFVMTHHPVSFSTEGGLGTTSGDFWQTLVGYGVTGLFSGHWHRYQPSQLGGGGSTWETIIGTGGGYIGFSPVRPYQQRHGFLLVEITGDEALATFYGDEDGDGHYDDILDQFIMAGDTPSGLVARYTFDDGPADTALQPPGRGLDLSLRGDAVLTLDGASGGALLLDGNNDFAFAGAIDDYVLNIKEPLSISLWARLDAVSGGDWANVLLTYATNDYYSEDEETNYAYWLNLEADGRLRMFWEHDNGNNVSVFSDPTDLGDGAWHHLAVVRAEGGVQFYVDGSPLGGAKRYDRSPTGGGRGMLYLGADTEGAGGYDMAGALDEICIYDVALTADQVTALASVADCARVIEPDEPDQELDDTGEDDDTGSMSKDDDTAGPADPDRPAEPSVPWDGDAAAWGCGCASAGGSSGGLWVLLVLGLVLRRRTGPACR